VYRISKNLFLKQKVMDRVLIALIPIIIYGIYRFGWRVLAVLAVTNLFSLACEYAFIRKQKSGKISMAVFVTGTLLGLILPPTIPFWMAAAGAVFAIAFGKMVFGGFGMNPFNPALVGRVFLFVSFPREMTSQWLLPYSSFPGGFTAYINSQAITGATRITEMSREGIGGLADLFWGHIPGSIGEISSFLIILAAIYMILTKTAKWQPVLGGIVSFIIFSFIFYGSNPLFHLFSGGIIFGMVFMITDPVSMPRHKTVIWINSILVGFLTVIIRKFASFPEGFMFALLLGNTFSPILDHAFNKKGGSKK
jgi:Na+-transporting NADH:ubiquinone oxidoreductase subunit B